MLNAEEFCFFLIYNVIIFLFRIIIHCITNYRFLSVFELFKKLYKQIHTV